MPLIQSGRIIRSECAFLMRLVAAKRFAISILRFTFGVLHETHPRTDWGGMKSVSMTRSASRIAKGDCARDRCYA